MDDEQLTPEQIAEQQAQQRQAESYRINSKPRRLIEKGQKTYRGAQEFAKDPRAAIEGAAQNVKDRALAPINRAKEFGEKVKQTPERIRQGIEKAKQLPGQVKKGAEALKTGAKAGKAAGIVAAKTGAKAGIEAAAGGATGGIGTLALAGTDAAVSAARKVAKKFGADLIGKIEDRIFDHFAKNWKWYLLAVVAIVFTGFMFLAGMIVFMFNAGFDATSTSGVKDIKQFESMINSAQITLPDDQKDFINQATKGEVGPRLLKFLNAISEDHKIRIRLVDETDSVFESKYNRTQVIVETADSIKCTDTSNNSKALEIPIYLDGKHDWSKEIIEGKKNLLCGIDYYPQIESSPTDASSNLAKHFRPDDFMLADITGKGLAASQYKIAQIIETATSYTPSTEGVTIDPSQMQIGQNLANKNFKNPTDMSLKTYFKTREDLNIQDVDALFRNPSTLESGAFIFFM